MVNYYGICPQIQPSVAYPSCRHRVRTCSSGNTYVKWASIGYGHVQLKKSMIGMGYRVLSEKTLKKVRMGSL